MRVWLVRRTLSRTPSLFAQRVTTAPSCTLAPQPRALIAAMSSASTEDAPAAPAKPSSVATTSVTTDAAAAAAGTLQPPAAAATAAGGSDSDSPSDPLIQYVLVRKDLDWPLGALMSQAVHGTLSTLRAVFHRRSRAKRHGCLCARARTRARAHARVAASVTAIWKSHATEGTRAYCNEGGRMHTVTLGASNEKELRRVVASCQAADVGVELWVEQPENIPAACATWPGRKSVLAPHFKGLRLMK
ncbi:hypothetical protein EON68_03175, partial [archaeon]